MECTVKREGNWFIIIVNGAINIETASDLKKVFDDVLLKGAKFVRLNLKNVPISNSSGIGNILMLFKSLKQRDGVLEIRGISKNLKEMMRLVKIDTLINIYDEE